MLKENRLQLLLPALIVLSFLAGSCKDETGTLGLDILPNEDLFTGIYSVNFVSAQNVIPEYLPTDDALYGIVGSVNDELTGHTTASFISQISLSTAIEQFKVDNDYVVDSLVLSLAYGRNWWFGDKDAPFNLKVFKFQEPLSPDEDYYSNMSVDGLYDPAQPIGERLSSAWDNETDSVWSQSNYVHQWRIKLNQSVTDEIFNLPQEALASNDAFKAAFPGLMVVAEPVSPDQKGSLVTIDLMSSGSNVTLYYHYYTRDENNVVTDTVNTGYLFPINRECVRINRFEHDAQGLIDDSSTKPNKLISQGMAGSYVQFDLRESIDFDTWQERLDPDVQSRDSLYGISSVDLFFKVDTTKQFSDPDFYAPIPSSLSLYVINEDGELEEPTYATGVSNTPTQNWFQGGSYNSETQEYQFRMTREYFELLIEGEQVSQGPFILTSPNSISDTQRVIFENSEDGTPNPRIEIKYVTFKKP